MHILALGACNPIKKNTWSSKLGGGVLLSSKLFWVNNLNLNNFRTTYKWCMFFLSNPVCEWTTFRRLLTFAVCQSVPQKLSGFGLRSPPLRGVQKRCLGQGANVCRKDESKMKSSGHVEVWLTYSCVVIAGILWFIFCLLHGQRG